MTQIDTTARIIHDCQCFLGDPQYPAEDSGFYRGFIWHEWEGLANLCLLPVEMPIEDAARIMGLSCNYGHSLTLGQDTPCMFPVAPSALYALVDRFWESLRSEMEGDR